MSPRPKRTANSRSASTAQTNRLDVYYESSLVGTLVDTDPLSFEYDGRWIANSDAFELPGIPLGPGRVANAALLAVFDNLLPEGALRDYISKQRQASSTFAMLLQLGGDTAGGLSILPHGQKPTSPAYRKTSWTELAALFEDKHRNLAVDLNARNARISLSGAQDKLLIAIDDDGEPKLPLRESPSTHILKPDIGRVLKVHHSAVNETIVMKAAAKAGLRTAEVFYEPITGSCIVKRFDRLSQGGRLTRLAQYDLCQLNGTIAERKYEAEGGPGIVRCAHLIRQYSSRPAMDLMRMLHWVFFNLYVGNNDSHAKNLSIYFHPKEGVALAPFYDLMCTRVYPGLASNFALTIGGESRPGHLRRDHVAQMALELGFRADYVLGIAEQMAALIVEAVQGAVSELEPELPHPGKALAQRTQWTVAKIVQQTTKRILAAR